MVGWYVDPSEQRAKARAMDRAMLEHNERRPARPSIPSRTEDEDLQIAAPVFHRPGFDTDAQAQARTRPPSTDPARYAARFRDGLPPPPPPTLTAYTEETDLAPWQQRLPQHPQELQPQHLLDQGVHPAPYPTAIPQDISRAMTGDVLSKSQRKRLKRKESKQRSERRGPPQPLAVDQQIRQRTHTNGHGHVPAPAPSPAYTPTQTQCDQEVVLTLQTRSPSGARLPVEHRLVCPLTPFPHPHQPHMVRVPHPTHEIFIGWYGPDE